MTMPTATVSTGTFSTYGVAPAYSAPAYGSPPGKMACGTVCTSPHVHRSVVHSSALSGSAQFSTHHASLDIDWPRALTQPLGSPPFLSAGWAAAVGSGEEEGILGFAQSSAEAAGPG